MKKIINYEKEILFKTKIGEVCTISLEQDFTVEERKLLGEFIVSGEYKASELSVNKEPFSYRLPLEYELESSVDIDTLNYEVDNFEYNIKDDELQIHIDFAIKYKEISNEPIIPDISLEEINSPISLNVHEDVSRIKPNENFADLPKLAVGENNIMIKEEKESSIITATNDEKDEKFIIYHVHIVRDGDTLESIALKYNTSVELIKEYNNTEILSIKNKLIIPEIGNE